MGSLPGSGRSSGGGHGNPLQYSCLENPMDRGALWAMVHRVAKKQVFSVWAEVKKVSKSLFWHVFSKYSFSVFGKLKSVSQPYRLDSSVIVVLSLVVKNPPANAGDVRDTGLIPGSGRSSGGGHGNPLQYSCLENPMDRGACWVRVHGVAQNQTPLRRYSIHVQFVK